MCGLGLIGLGKGGECLSFALQRESRKAMSASLRFLVSTVLIKWKNGAPSRGGASEMTMSSCMCEPMETAQSLGDDTHAVVTRLKGHQSTDCTVCGSWRRCVESLAHQMRARTRTRANVNVRPRPLVETNKPKNIEKGGRDKNSIINTSTT